MKSKKIVKIIKKAIDKEEIKLPPLDDVQKVLFNDIIASFNHQQIDTLTAHLNHFNDKFLVSD